eukprot:scaffold166518_cov19-Prasinocladus_malaysianus.AAC.1
MTTKQLSFAAACAIGVAANANQNIIIDLHEGDSLQLKYTTMFMKTRSYVLSFGGRCGSFAIKSIAELPSAGSAICVYYFELALLVI